MMDVLLVDEHEALREGLKILLDSRGIRTIGTAGSAASAAELLGELRPDVAVIDVTLPDESGLRLTRRLLLDRPDLAVMIYTGVENVVTLAEALECDAPRLEGESCEIFDLLAQGLTGEEIAVRLTVSPDTVRTHIRNAMQKLHKHTRTGAVVKALKAEEIEG